MSSLPGNELGDERGTITPAPPSQTANTRNQHGTEAHFIVSKTREEPCFEQLRKQVVCYLPTMAWSLLLQWSWFALCPRSTWGWQSHSPNRARVPGQHLPCGSRTG